MNAAPPESTGVLYVHSVPAAMAPHVEWAVERVLGRRLGWAWQPQPVAPGTLRTVVTWQGRPGAAGRLASVLRDWERLRFEVTEDPGAHGTGDRYSWTPGLGMFHAATAGNGDLVVGEEQLRCALARAASGEADLAQECARLLGDAWDGELEAFRAAADLDAGAAGVRWLHEVG